MNDLAHALLLSHEAIAIADTYMTYTVKLDDVEEQRSRSRRMDAALVSSQP
jgi:hypothetical protein